MSASRPPSLAAHQLAWFIDVGRVAALDVLARYGVSTGFVHRLLTGEVEPAEEIAVAIAGATGGAVLPEYWSVATTLGWLDRPAPHVNRGTE